ncbi:MAG: helix-turn-helix transcriptional regulator [Phycisphaera sp.]|nr:MAG: helix-turn-helix transcriptional regulator [Phycisphaera sp.]
MTPSPDDRAMGLAVRELRATRKLSQDAVATLIGISPSTLSRKESGEISIGKHELRKFAQVLKVSVHDIHRIQAEYLRQETEQEAVQSTEPSEGSVARQMQSALEGIGQSIVEVCETSRGRRRQAILEHIVAYAKWLAETSKHSDDVGVQEPIIGEPYTGPMLKAPAIVLGDGTLVERYVPAVSVVRQKMAVSQVGGKLDGNGNQTRRSG